MTAATLVATTALAIVIGLPAAAQVVEPLPLLIEDADSSAHPTVELTVAMPSEFVGIELDADAFSVVENGRPVDALRVASVPSGDLEVVLVLDVSGSMAGSPLAAAQDAALNFVDAMPPGVRVSVVTFSNETSVANEFTTDMDEIAAAVVELSASGETALYDGLVVASQQFNPDLAARRSVVLLSDGGDTVSESTLEHALVGLLGTSVSFYAIELQTPENDPVALSRLAAATGGSVVAATDPDALGGIFEEIAAQLVNRYLLRYQSEAFGATDVEVAVAAAGATASAVRSIRMPPAPQPEPTPVEPEAAQEPEPLTVRPGAAVELGVFQQSVGFYVGLLLVLAGLVGVFFAMRNVRFRKERLLADEAKALVPAEQRRTPLTAIADRAVRVADRSVQGERGGKINARLEQAGVSMRPAEFVVLTAIACVIGLSAGWILFGPLGGIAGVVLAFLGVQFVLRHKANKRIAAFDEQLPDTLHLMAGSLRAGFGLLQAVDVIAAEAPSPTAEEFQRVKVEIHLGRDMDEALRAMAERVGSEDFRWVSDGIQIHREVGGDIAEIIDSVNETIRARNQTRRRIKALSAEGRMSATVLIALPIGLALLISVINPEYVAELTGSSIGRFLIGLGIAGMVVGVFWIRRIVRIEF